MAGAEGGAAAHTDLSMEDLLLSRPRPDSTGNRMIREVLSANDLADKEYLTLKVVRHSQDLEIHFRVKRTTMMIKLKRSYSDRVGVNGTNLRFLYEGRRIMDDDTPGSLEMESGDYIEVFMGLGLNQPEAEVSEVVTGEKRKISFTQHLSNAGPGGSGERREVGEEGEEGGPRNKKIKLSSHTDTEAGIEAVRENLAKVTRKYEELVRKLRDKVECPVCFDVPKSAPVPVCPNGHVVCVKCVREVCPTCRVRMEHGTSTLAVTVIENIEHTCEHEDCGQSLPHSEIQNHMAVCSMRPVNCPGLDCGLRMARVGLLTHMTGCCVERGEVRAYSLPHRFTYMMNEDVNSLEGEGQNFNWKLEAVQFDNKVFFLKVTRKARTRRWYFYVQMVGYEEQAQHYSMEMTICRPDEGPGGKYTQKISGDICPLEVTSVEAADEKGFCLALRDGAMAKYFLRNKNTEENEFSVSLNISKILTNFEMANSEDLEQLMSITGADRNMAENLLEACGGNLEMAVNMHMEDTGGGVSGLDGGSGLAAAAEVPDEEEVRAPIPQKQEVMVGPGFEGYMMNNRVNKSLQQRRVRSVFDGFRDFQAETRNMEDRLEQGLPVSKSKKKTLEELFKPPLDLMYQGDWQAARDHADKTKRWLLVNIQDAQEFQCQVLNRDLWSNQGVKSIVREHFVFWQQYKESDEAVRYMTFYKITDWPYIAIIDPRTGENMVTWSKIDSSTFPELITEFLSLHPSLDTPVKEPPRKKMRSENILEMDEEAQMAAAIKASLAETLENGGGESSEDDLETFTDDDNTNNSFEFKKKSASGTTNGGPGVCSPEKEKGERARLPSWQDEDPSWESFLGHSQEAANILIRWPDGSRDSWAQPADTKLRSLLLFISTKGFSQDHYEVVTNFPRRQIDCLDQELSLKDASLFPRETVFVHLKDN